MTASYDLLLKGGTVVNHDGRAERDVGIRGGRIAALGDLSGAAAGETIDAKGLTILPGVIDTQVHFREPGLEHKEDLETGSRAAVLGGVTAVFEMPNTQPLTTSAEALADKVARARHRMHCDFAFYVGGTRENIDAIPALERLEGSAGIKVFMGSSTGNLLVDDEPSLDRIVARISRRAAFHAEDEARLKERAGLRRPGDPASHPVWRDAQAALIATRAAGAPRRGARQARARAARLDRGGDGVPGGAQGLGQRGGDAAPPDAGGARVLRAPRHLRADEPAGARMRTTAPRCGRRWPQAWWTCWAPTTPRTPARRRTTPIPPATRA